MSDASSSPSSIPANEEPSVVFIGIHKPSEKALKRSKPTSINDFFKKKRGRKRQYFNKKKKARFCIGKNNQYISTERADSTSNISIVLKRDENNS